MLKEFQEFALKGNVVDMAVGIIIGGAFGTIVKSLVADIIMPPIGLLVGGIDFASLVITLREASEGVDAVTINYGVFLNNVFAFLIVAWALFMVIKSMNAMRKKEEEAPSEPEAPPKQEVLLEEIRDIMQKQAS